MIRGLFSGSTLDLENYLGRKPSSIEELWYKAVQYQNELFAEMSVPPHKGVSVSSFKTYEEAQLQSEYGYRRRGQDAKQQRDHEEKNQKPTCEEKMLKDDENGVIPKIERAGTPRVKKRMYAKKVEGERAAH